ncbi:PQQ-binding-like beta-propeller repeat protein [Dactylosporangium sp. NPDC005555]|uniref:outer membrane protein assembly factor BamB family protein n=1 Tax=Dactylosporangium sp. NPDC005555 TaxID=3154889 RepID=UPI0033BDC8D5
MEERLIDLGVVNHHADQLEIGPPPPAPGRRQWPFVTVLALLAAFTGGSVSGSSVEVLGVLAEHTVGFVADRVALYALREEPAVTAYDWGTGEERWSRSIPPNAGQVYLAADRAYIRHRPCTDATGWSLERLDPADGHQQWLAAGAPVAVLRAGQEPDSRHPLLLLVDERAATCPPAVPLRNSPQTPVHLAAIDAESGVVRWQFQMPAGGRLVSPDVPGNDWFAIWYPGGHTEVRAAATGAVISAAEVPELADGPPQSVRIVGDMLVIVAVQLDGALITSYGHEPLVYRWQRLFQSAEPVPIAELAYGPVVVACGPMVCVPNWRDIAVLDPRTGEQRWRRPIQLDAVGAGVLVARDREDFMRIRIVDWQTGVDRSELVGWGLVPTATDGIDDAAGTAATAGATWALVQKPDGGSSRIARVNLHTGEVEVLGQVSPIPSRCALRGHRLSCLAGGDSVHLWKL